MIEFSELPGWAIAALPVIALLGLYLLSSKKKNTSHINHFSKEYFKGLNHLLNDEQDKALDIFVKLVETDWDTIDTHFALGKIYRKNGEIDKAIKIHQGLIARPSLPERYRNKVLLELGYDYLGAGWFDRAEGLFKEVLIHDPKSEIALHNLILIYQQEKDWHKAIGTAENLFSENPAKVGPMISQYYCELADLAKGKGDINQVEHNANQSLRYDSSCVRATILLADLAMNAGDYAKAKELLMHVEQQDADFLPIIMDRLVECHHQLDETEDLLDYLDDLESRLEELPLIESHARVIERYKDKDAAIKYVLTRLKQSPSLQGMTQLFRYRDTETDNESYTMMLGLKSAVDVMWKDQSAYQCRQCGFKSNTLYWMCPSCHNWGSVKPFVASPGVDA